MTRLPAVPSLSVSGRVARAIRAMASILSAMRNGRECVESITVFGCTEFRQEISEALLLLRDNDLPAWATLRTHVEWIVEGWKSFIMVTLHPAYIFISRKDADQTVVYRASVLSHMACSCELHRGYEMQFPRRRVPREVFSGPVAQESCMKAYYECMAMLSKSTKPGSPGST
jgi:hypothetical protein